MDCYLHASEAESFATDEVECLGHIERDDIPSSPGGPVVEWVVGDAVFIVSLVHLKNIHLVPIIHENWK